MPAHNHHDHLPKLQKVRSAFIIGISLNLLFVIIEVVAGLTIHSLSLIADAGHNFADVISLGLAFFAFRLQKIPSTEQFTYGYQKTTILVALFNAVLLLV